MRPRVKTVPWVRDGDDIVVALNPTAADLRRFPDPERALERVLGRADGSRTAGQIALATEVDDHELTGILRTLDDAGLLVDADELAALSGPERARWRNNLGFYEAYATVENGPLIYHQRLRDSRVLLLGAGGLGSMMLMNLAGLGVGEIVLVDFDTVEAANFTRQFTYALRDVGSPKVARAAEWARSFTEHTTVTTVARRIESSADVVALLDGIDLVVSVIDQPAAAASWVNEACVRAAVPALYGGFFFTTGRYESVLPGHSACLACLLLGESFQLQPINRATGPSVSIVGGLMALEAVRYLTGFAPPVSAARSWMVDFTTGAVTPSIRWGRSPDCAVCGEPAAGTEPGTPPNGAPTNGAPLNGAPLNGNSRVDLSHVTVVPDGDEFLVGDLARSIFVAVPPVGALVVESLQRGATIAEATTDASVFAGTDVNVLEFVGVLRDRGLVRGTAAPAETTAPEPVPAPEGWRRTVSGIAARLLLSAPAWVLYTAALVAGLTIFLLEPALRPNWEAIVFLPDPALALLVNIATVLTLTAIHEGFHWLAARRLNLPARMSVSRRGLFLVFETDLTRLWAVPRRQRYGAFLAGMAFDGTVLGTALMLRLAHQHGWIVLPETLNRYLAVVVLSAVITLVAQTPLFMRTDLYAVMVTVLGCHNLYRVAMLYVKGRLVGLRPAERDELANASARDRQVGRWFSALYLFGVIGLTYLLFGLFLPGAFSLIAWSVQNVLGAMPTTALFWEALAVALFLSAEMVWPPVNWLIHRPLWSRWRRPRVPRAAVTEGA